MIMIRTTYAPDGSFFCRTRAEIKNPIRFTVAATVAHRVEIGWDQTDVNQIAKVDDVGFLDIVTYTESEQ